VQYSFQWKTLSAVAGLTFWDFYFRLYPKTVRSPEVVDFLQALLRHLDRPLLIVWDRLPSHRSRLVHEFIQAVNGRIAVESLPAYAPELNPVEYIWAYWKQHELPNACPRDWWELNFLARRTLRRMRRKTRLVPSFWKQAELSL
jgi:transposase